MKFLRHANSVELAMVTFWVAIFAWRLVATMEVYLETPHVENFRLFAEPGSSRVEGKLSYLFSPVLVLGAGLAIGVVRVVKSWMSMSDIDTSKRRVLLREMLIMTLMLMAASFLSWLQCHRALQQAVRHCLPNC